jgi:hypothetical protein
MVSTIFQDLLNFNFKKCFSDIVTVARTHIHRWCKDLTDKRVFNFGGAATFDDCYIDPDLVNMKYDNNVTHSDRESRWKEDGEHFGREELIKQIVQNVSSGGNFLIEV